MIDGPHSMGREGPPLPMRTRRQFYSETGGRATPPPPPPQPRPPARAPRPPPPPTSGPIRLRGGAEDVPVADMAIQTEETEWVLTVRPPAGRPIPILVNDTTTAPALAARLQQAASMPTLPVGLFDGQGVFVSLEYAINCPNRGQLYSLEQPPLPPPHPPSKIPWFEIAVVAPVVTASLLLLYYHGETLFHRSMDNIIFLLDWTLEQPLISLYRSGPSWIGWEGRSLPSICTRITYHGDSGFWNRNLTECQEIYESKLRAWLQVARPTLYVCLALLVAVIVRWIMWEAHVRRVLEQQHRADRDMVETYRAFRVLIDQIRRAMNGPKPHAPPQHM